jgi:hypothetical protein
VRSTERTASWLPQFSKYVRHGPKLALVSFTATASARRIQVDHPPPQYCPGDGCNLAIGAVARLGSQDTKGIGPPPTDVQTAVPWVAAIVKSEIDSDKAKSERDKRARMVDGPVSVLVLTRGVKRWPDGYHETCPDNQP